MNAFLLAFSIIAFLSVCLFLLMFNIYTLKQADFSQLSIGAGSLLPGFLGCFMQTILLVSLLWDANGNLNLGLSNALLLCACIMTVLCLSTSLVTPLAPLLLIMLPIDALSVIISVAYPTTKTVTLSPSPSLHAHILLSICAYSILAFASLVAVLFAIKDWQVKNHRLCKTLPSLQSLEKLLFQLLNTGFALLTIGILIGFVDLEEWFTHKVIFSIIAWLVFACLLMGRYFWGWRGKKAIKLTLTGMVFLLLAFFGSKIVLEIILTGN